MMQNIYLNGMIERCQGYAPIVSESKYFATKIMGLRPSFNNCDKSGGILCFNSTNESS